MKEQPLFAPGQEVICVDSKFEMTGLQHSLIEGKEYVIDDNNYKCPFHQLETAVTLKGIPRFVFAQSRFIPKWFDRYAEETFHQSLKGKPVNA